MNYEVYLVKYLGQPRNHHALFVCTNGRDGRLFHVIGSILKGMTYEVRETKDPLESATFDGRKQIGWVSSSDLGRFDAICRSNPPPEQQYIGPRRIDRHKPLRRCQEWTAETIQLLQSHGVLVPVSGEASGSSSRSGGERSSSSRHHSRHSASSSAKASSSSSGRVDGETSGDGYWTWSAAYGDWYHLGRSGQYTWSKQGSSSSRGR